MPFCIGRQSESLASFRIPTVRCTYMGGTIVAMLRQAVCSKPSKQSADWSVRQND